MILAPIAPVRADTSPAAVYLATLARTGRRAQECALRSIASILCPGADLLCVPWHQLRYQHVAAVREWLVEHAYAPATVNRWLSALRGVLRQGWLLGLVAAEDYQRAKEVPPARGRRLPAGRALSREEVSRLLEVCSPRDRAAVALLYGAGLRVAEAVELEVGRVDLGRRLVRLVGKGNAEREVPLSPWVVSELEAWYRVRGGANGPVLVGATGQALHPNGLASSLGRAVQRAAIEHATPHDLRRTFVTLLLGTGYDLATVQALAGHADPRTTSRYDRRGTEDRRAAVDSLGMEPSA